MRALLLALAIALPAHAMPGFFRDPGDRTITRGELKDTSYVCAMRIRYNIASPAWVELSGLTLGCYRQMAAAFNAAQGKVFVLGEPAQDPVYDCTISVFWNDPTAPFLAYSPNPDCVAGRNAALRAAAAMG